MCHILVTAACHLKNYQFNLFSGFFENTHVPRTKESVVVNEQCLTVPVISGSSPG